MIISINKITAKEAHDILNNGGLNFILFKGDTFDADLFEEFYDCRVDNDDVSYVEFLLSELEDDEALQLKYCD